MITKPNINKENFFNGMMEKYPDATQQFCDWIDEYKKECGMHEWLDDDSSIAGLHPIKFHHLPYEMQKGIIHRFVKEKANQDMINFTMEGLLKDFEKVLEHLQDKANYKKGER